MAIMHIININICVGGGYYDNFDTLCSNDGQNVYSLVSISAMHADTDYYWATGYISQLEPNFTEFAFEII